MNIMKSMKKRAVGIIFFCTALLYAQNREFKVEVVGQGEPVLLFPGFTCTAKIWDDLVTELSKTNQCHIFTFAGFGGVPAIEKPWLPKIKKGLEEYIDKMALENSTLIGHSLGGSLALWLGTEDSYNFNKIIVVDALPSVGALMIPNFNKEHIVYDNPYNQRLLEMNQDEFKTMAIQFAQGMSLNTEKHQQIIDWIIQADRETYVYGYTDLLKLDLRDDIAKIKSPIFILGATHPFGEEIVKKTFESQYAQLKDYSIKYVKESAHFIMYDQPEWFVEMVLSEL